MIALKKLLSAKCPLPRCLNEVMLTSSFLHELLIDLFRIRKLSNGNLVIRDIRTSDAGTYKCVASNKHGEAESETEVTVLCK